MSNKQTNQTTTVAIAAGEAQHNDIAQTAQTAPVQHAGITTPMIPEEVYNNLPDFLKRACEVFEGRERDVFFTAALTALSGCFSSVKGIYNQQEVHSNLFAMIVADAASGKGSASHARALMEPIHQATMTTPDENSEQAAIRTPFIIPGNISSAAMVKALEQSRGIGVIFETEIDTVTEALKQEWGNFSDMLRKAFHHEPVTLARKTNNEYAEVRRPQPAVLLTGTPGQAITLLRSPENGLLSRFMFYYFSNPIVWQDVFPVDKPNLTAHFDGLAGEVLAMYGRFKTGSHLFDLTARQKSALNAEFAQRLRRVAQFEADAVSSVKRLGLITFRIAMVLSIIRAATVPTIASSIICNDIDFRTAMTLTGIYLEHVLLFIDLLPRSAALKPDIARFYDALPPEFTRSEAVAVALRLGLKERVVGNYLLALAGKYIEKVKHGHYKKV